MVAGSPRPGVAACGARSKLTVIIPTLNEERTIVQAVDSAYDAMVKVAPEVLVVDGGSRDATVRLAERSLAKVLSCQPGRAKQMNTGCAHSSGDFLLFLHADSKLSVGYQEMLESAITKPQPHRRQQHPETRACWGCFETINTDISNSLLRTALALAVKLRTRWQHMPYGDQAIFVKSSLFRELGGYKEMPIMEDYELVQRLRKHSPPAIIPHAVTTSGRRWQRLGFFRTLLTNQAIILAYHCGVPPDTLLQWYRGGK